MKTLEKLKNWFKLIWFKLTIAFKKSSMKNLITRIENCLRTQVFNSFDNVQLKITPSAINNRKVNQLVCEIGMNNCRIGIIVIDITDANNVKYEYDSIIDERLLQPLSDFANNLNQNKTNINGWIGGYHKTHPRQ